jgi:excisionase family DNA binding protein
LFFAAFKKTKKQMNTQALPELLTIKQAAAALSVHPNTLRNWERDGRIDSVRIGTRRDRRFSKDVIWGLMQFTPTSQQLA